MQFSIIMAEIDQKFDKSTPFCQKRRPKQQGFMIESSTKQHDSSGGGDVTFGGFEQNVQMRT